MKGFINIGNTCYLNSGLQMLIQNKELCNLIIKYSSSSHILQIISKFIMEYYLPDSCPISPIEIKKIVEEKKIYLWGLNNKIQLNLLFICWIQ